MADEDRARPPDDAAEDLLSLPSGRLFPDDEDDEYENPSPPASPARSSNERGWLRINNVGGSLTFLLQIALCAWGIRQLRSVLARRQEQHKVRTMLNGEGRGSFKLLGPVDPPSFAPLSPTAVKKLVELDPTPHLLIDVRRPEVSSREPKAFDTVVTIPEREIRACLALSDDEWSAKFPSTKKPGRDDLIVFLSNRGKRAQRVAATVANLGYNGCCILKGGIEALRVTSSVNGEGLHYMSRDAVALLLHYKELMIDEKNVGANTPWLIDLRRHDERALYGHIKGSMHIRVEEWPKALAKDSTAYEKQYHAPKIATNDLIILQCRSSRRASWAAYLAQDAGYKRCFVYKEGSYGWRLDPTVLPYDSYEMGEVPPDPVKFDVERVNFEGAQSELKLLGLTKSRKSEQ